MAAGIVCKIITVIILGVLTNSSESVGTLRLCGRELADALALVCQGRGYNVAFKPQGYRGGRYKRGIVDECCRKGCTLKTLESYCSDTLPIKKDTLQISKRSELSSTEVQTSVSTGKRQGDKQTLNNFIRHSKSRKLLPLVLIYSKKTIDPSGQVANLDMTLKKTEQSKQNKEEIDDPFLKLDYNLENEPLDTEEIMAEVVESSPEINISREKRSLEASNKQDNLSQSFYLGRMLAQNHHQNSS